MASIYISIILCFRVVQALFNKRSSMEIKNIPMLLGYNTFKNFISAALGLVLILASGAHFNITPMTLLISLFSGVSLFLSGFFGIYAMKSGTVSLNSMFGTAGMIIPIFAGVFLFDTNVAPMQFVGLALFFVSAYFLIGSSKIIYSNFSYKTFLLLIGSLIANGCSMLAQQLFTEYVPDGDVSVFSFLSFGIISVLSGIFYSFIVASKKEEKSELKLSKALLVCGVALAVSVFVINQLATISTAFVAPVILFTFINGGGTIISTIVASLVYKEKINVKTVLGVVIGIISLVIIKAFE